MKWVSCWSWNYVWALDSHLVSLNFLKFWIIVFYFFLKTLFLISGTYLCQFCFIWTHTIVMTFFLMPIHWVIEVFCFVLFCFFALLSKYSASWIENSWWQVYCSRNCLTVTVGVNSIFLISSFQFYSSVHLQNCLLIYHTSELSDCSHLISLMTEHGKVLDEFFHSTAGKLIIS